MGIKLIVFDMAGTTVEDDRYVAGALQSSLEYYGYHVSVEEINKVMGYAKPVAIQLLLSQCYGEEYAAEDELVGKIHTRFVNAMVSFYKDNEHISEKQNTRNVFHALRAHDIKVAIDTGFSRPIADTIFQRLGWEQGVHFDVSITSDEVDRGRPYPDMIFKAMSLCGITDADEVVKVGDTASDLQQGIAAGCRYVIGVTTGASSQEVLQREVHTHLIADLKELLPVLGIGDLIFSNQV